jgi:CRISPR system Cascade subunit CasB
VSNLIERLEQMNATDSKVRAVLRRSLSSDPGEFAGAFRYVEPFLSERSSEWQREIFYLVAGLWAAHWRAGRPASRETIAEACAAYRQKSASSSVEHRFIQLLDADADQLAHRLRQMVALLKDYPLDFSSMLRDLLYWNRPRRRTQIAWARQFYRRLGTEPKETTRENPQ